ncbi:MAG TPA: adenylate/guanylate cyclase domain-containing protein [Chitinophagaceae bacterium]
MEKNIAILMADLSGYTALTETHGAVAAADLIDRYIQIVKSCLKGDCRLHERTGDEIMVVSSSPDFLLATAAMIGKLTSNEEYFLQIHGGLHYGKVLQRENRYFGSAINLTSRIASKANAGSFWCSDEFVNALSDKNQFPLTSKGNQVFKNVSIEKQIFELNILEEKAVYVDPICRMLILDTSTAISHPEENGKYFCSPDCLAIYDAT